MHIAVVVTKGGTSGRPMGDFASFIAETQDEAVEAALDARGKWQKERSTRYIILTGVLTHEISVPVAYKANPINKAALGLGRSAVADGPITPAPRTPLAFAEDKSEGVKGEPIGDDPSRYF